ncbi:hypothetical protein THTE_1869 [Thermogutta terrifontis]|jgi:hypothetical protein|uniref:Uncharacterized protein n=1 Tax=Thermogutta terrifontis TaxID=1331910 RepID=A0A286REU2_9BACT|nr:hypothetical protein [Thermogutta terrifontis]ASV74471.1 hypothetical protein THTE_1869 [Thermogutta terrifontis]
MNRQYEIACECGRKVSVSAGQSGTTLVCQCGRQVTVPSWGELLRQETRVAVAGTSEQASYSPLAGWVTGFRWLGLGLILLAVLGMLYLYRTMPSLPDLHRVPPAVVYNYFRVLRTGVDGPMPRFERDFIEHERIWRGLWDLVILVAIVGAILVAGITVAEWWEQRHQKRVAEAEDGDEEKTPPE